MIRLLMVTGRDVRYVVNVAQIVSMVPDEQPISGGKILLTAIVTTNPNEECWAQESIEDILRAIASQEPGPNGIDTIDVAQWARYHAKTDVGITSRSIGMLP